MKKKDESFRDAVGDVAPIRSANRVEPYRVAPAPIPAKRREDEHAVLEDGEVVVPPHITAGYEQLRAAGLVSLPLSPAYGGFGLPSLISNAYLEMVARADSSLMTIVGLQAGVAHDIESYGNDELKQRYLPGFASGQYQGCMDLTEPGAGSDLGGISTRARREGDRYIVDGEKIFITNGGAPIPGLDG